MQRTFFLHIFGRSKKRALLTFLTLLYPNFMPSFRKIVGAIFRDQFVRYIHTYIHPDKGDLIEPVAFAGSIYLVHKKGTTGIHKRWKGIIYIFMKR